jgi:O-antigen/teichoic acid export membrane protein
VYKLKQLLTSWTGLLTISQLISLGFGFISSIIIANSLGIKKFGIFTFYFSITSIFLLFFRFGYFSSIGVLIVKTNNKKRQSELIGAGFVLSILIGVIYSLFLFLISNYIDDFFKSNIRNFIINTLVFLIFLPLTMYINQVVQSLNKYKPLIIYNILSASISFIIILFLYFSHILSIEYLIFAKIIPMSIVILSVFIICFNMKFSNLFKNLAIINLKNRKHGFHLYLGQIVDQSIYKSDELMIQYFVGNSELGLYKIAQQLINPFGILAKNYAFSKFKIIAKSSFIDKKFQKNIFLISIYSIITSLIFSYIVINYFYIDEYKFAFYIVIILSFAVFINSITQLYNIFLTSHSMGKYSKNANFRMAFFNLIGNFVLIPILSGLGAALSSIIAVLIYFINVKNIVNKGIKHVK